MDYTTRRKILDDREDLINYMSMSMRKALCNRKNIIKFFNDYRDGDDEMTVSIKYKFNNDDYFTYTVKDILGDSRSGKCSINRVIEYYIYILFKDGY